MLWYPPDQDDMVDCFWLFLVFNYTFFYFSWNTLIKYKHYINTCMVFYILNVLPSCWVLLLVITSASFSALTFKLLVIKKMFVCIYFATVCNLLLSPIINIKCIAKWSILFIDLFTFRGQSFEFELWPNTSKQMTFVANVSMLIC